MDQIAEAARSCPVCQGDRTGFLVEKAGYRFSKCVDCAFVYVDPEIAQTELTPIYAGRGAPPSGVRYPFDKAKHRRRRARVRAWRLARYIRGHDVIDVGCGGGFMVEAMRRRGGRAIGIDPDPAAIAYARAHHHADCRFFDETLARFAARGLTFDFCHSAQVIEHVGQVNELVGELARLVRPGGWLYLKTPDRDHWRVKQDPSRWPDPPAYVQYFTRPSIKALLVRHGFQVRRIFFDFKPSIQLIARRTANKLD